MKRLVTVTTRRLSGPIGFPWKLARDDTIRSQSVRDLNEAGSGGDR